MPISHEHVTSGDDNVGRQVCDDDEYLPMDILVPNALLYLPRRRRKISSNARTVSFENECIESTTKVRIF